MRVLRRKKLHRLIVATSFYLPLLFIPSLTDRGQLKQARQKHQRKREREASFFLDNNNNNMETIDGIKKLVHFTVPLFFFFFFGGGGMVFSFAYTMNHKKRREKSKESD
jgi:hypothetical protein